MAQRLTNLSVEYADFLHKLRKSNGDKLLPSTIERYVENLNPYTEKLGNFDDVGKLVEYMNQQILRRRSIVVHSAFRNYLIFLGYDQHDDKQVFAKLRSPPHNANAFTSKRFIQSKILSRSELKRIFEGCHDDFEKMVFSVLYDTACRRSELLHIRVKDITFKKEGKDDTDLENGIYADVLLHGKGGKTRTVCLSKISVELIKKFHPIEEKERKIVEFRKRDGTLYKSQSQELYRLVVKKSQRVLNRHIHPHAFRHTSITHLADNGATAMQIMAYAGHENITTSQIYIQISSFMGRRGYAQHGRPIID